MVNRGSRLGSVVMTAKLNDSETKVLAALVEASGYEGFGYLGFASLSSETRLDRKKVRRACRSLARKGLAEYGRGLWTEDGELAGSGYAATPVGAQRAGA